MIVYGSEREIERERERERETEWKRERPPICFHLAKNTWIKNRPSSFFREKGMSNYFRFKIVHLSFTTTASTTTTIMK